MGDQALEQEPLALEKRYWQAQKGEVEGRGGPG